MASKSKQPDDLTDAEFHQRFLAMESESRWVTAAGIIGALILPLVVLAIVVLSG